MEEKAVLGRIDELAREEHELFKLESQGKATISDQERLQQLEVMLDQCWDLLRQRRARSEYGLDPDEAHMRDEKTIKGYVG
jgi:hypothetical protein